MQKGADGSWLRTAEQRSPPDRGGPPAPHRRGLQPYTSSALPGRDHEEPRFHPDTLKPVRIRDSPGREPVSALQDRD